ncbi:beta/alpha barrel domain-containing protein [Gluconobacter albidus]|uniref:Fructose-bisphosphate aldolase n=1 Tax=Gluconobacter albidus TaxID=318683 RepID=A0AAW3QUX1_9PROT|nr:hypothetical protein [Gluconobacter albidus]KXV37412.1 hypothetical protein AD941_10830 [Gluconobacter albidus]GBQ84334.1 hypothetical protein AA3250_0501 [Gluconobacter albidus NBRC 3250]GLQ70304.1 hypothetical protein GCM10007866_27570 [Gluconobacter albidus]
MNRYEEKIARMLAGQDDRTDFILADAKDSDMAAGISATGLRRDLRQGHSRFRTRREYVDVIHGILQQDIVDIMLTSASILETLIAEDGFAGTRIQSAIRANDTTDLWRGRGGSYQSQKSVPFRSASLKKAQTSLGLYSMTFNGDAAQDSFALEEFARFREEAGESRFSYFLEVFNPNEGRIAQADRGFYLNDMIVRCLAGLRREERPVFLKVPFNGADALSELCAFDPSVIVGIMGGSSGTTRDCLELIHQAQCCGARAALFGRKIVDADDPLLLIEAMRSVTDGALSAKEATHLYHEKLGAQGVPPLREADLDSVVTEAVLLEHAA